MVYLSNSHSVSLAVNKPSNAKQKLESKSTPNLSQTGRKEMNPKPEVFRCRACNIATTECLHLSEEYRSFGIITTLAGILSYCASVDVLDDKPFLPKHICKPCVKKLDSVFEFKRNVQNTDIMLRKRLFEQQQFNTESPSTPPFLSPSPTIRLHMLNADDDGVADADMGSTNTADEYVYVIENTESMMVTSLSNESTQKDADGPVIKLDSSDSSSPKSAIYEFDFEPTDPDSDLENPKDPNSYLEDPTDSSSGLEDAKDPHCVKEESDQESNGELEEKIVIIKSCVKPRSQRRRKSLNPALKCKECAKQLSTKNSLKYHMQLHGDNCPFVCRICGDSFKTRNSYDGHTTLHNPNNPNKCQICGKTYRQAQSLRSHLLSHTGLKPFNCDICGKGLTQKAGYKKHMLTHTGEKPHTCDICGRSFRYSSNLIAHKRSHVRPESPIY